jgi:hypothetical protein
LAENCAQLRLTEYTLDRFFRQVSAKFGKLLRSAIKFLVQVLEIMKENGGRYWDRTNDHYDVNVVLYR